MKKITTRRRFHPYTSRKNMKRALNKGHHAFAPPRSEGLSGMGAMLAPLLLAKSQASARSR